MFEGSGFGFPGSGLEIGVSGFRIRDWRFGFRVSGFGIGDSGFGFPDSGFEIRVSGFRIRDSRFGFRVSGFGSTRATNSRHFLFIDLVQRHLLHTTIFTSKIKANA